MKIEEIKENLYTAIKESNFVKSEKALHEALELIKKDLMEKLSIELASGVLVEGEEDEEDEDEDKEEVKELLSDKDKEVSEEDEEDEDEDDEEVNEEDEEKDVVTEKDEDEDDEEEKEEVKESKTFFSYDGKVVLPEKKEDTGNYEDEEEKKKEKDEAEARKRQRGE